MPSAQPKTNPAPTSVDGQPAANDRAITGVIARMISPAASSPKRLTHFDGLHGARAASAPGPTDSNPRLAAVSASISRGLALLVTATATLTLLGWLLHVPALRNFAQPVAMNPASALAFPAAGISLWLSRPTHWGGRQRNTAMILAAVTTLIGLVKLLGFMGGVDLRFDRALFVEQLGQSGMSPNSAVGLVLVGAALLLLDVNRRTKRVRRATAIARSKRA